MGGKGGRGHWIKAWSKSGNVVFFPPAESEFYAAPEAVAEAFGLQAACEDAGLEVNLQMMADVSAALGIIERKGRGRFRHIETNRLWIQEVAAKRKVTFSKVKGPEDPAHLMTKELEMNEFDKYVDMIGQCTQEERTRCHLLPNFKLWK